MEAGKFVDLVGAVVQDVHHTALLPGAGHGA